MRYIYGIFFTRADGKAVWALGRNKRAALRFGKANHAIVGRVTDVAEISAYDSPTFRATMEVIADYREVDDTYDPNGTTH